MIIVHRSNQTNELCHYGIKGQKWGVRRWQYEDGRFNREGKERYFGDTEPGYDMDNRGKSGNKSNRKIDGRMDSRDAPQNKSLLSEKQKIDSKKDNAFREYKKVIKDQREHPAKTPEELEKQARIRKTIIIAAGAAVAAGVIGYGMYKANKLSSQSTDADEKLYNDAVENIKKFAGLQREDRLDVETGFGDITLKQGTELQHLGRGAADDFFSRYDTGYYTYDTYDNTMYKTGAIVMANPWTHEFKGTTNKDLKVAGIDTLIDLYGKNATGANRKIIDKYKDQSSDKVKEFIKSELKHIVTYGPYNQSADTTEQYNNLLNVLRDNGYAGLVDLHDKIDNGAKAPIILFNNNENMTISSVGTEYVPGANYLDLYDMALNVANINQIRAQATARKYEKR